MDDKYFSVDHEPALSDGRFETDPAEQRAGPLDQQQGEIEQLRDSVAAEPALPQHADPAEWNRWLAARRRLPQLGTSRRHRLGKAEGVPGAACCR